MKQSEESFLFEFLERVHQKTKTQKMLAERSINDVLTNSDRYVEKAIKSGITVAEQREIYRRALSKIKGATVTIEETLPFRTFFTVEFRWRSRIASGGGSFYFWIFHKKGTPKKSVRARTRAQR